MSRVAFTLHNALTQWAASPFAIFVVAVLVLLAYLYLLGDWRLASKGRRWPHRRTAAFLGGLVAVDLALQSPVATFTGSYFEAHVVQHLLLMVVAPPLLALGAPSTLFLQTASRNNKVRWLSVLRSRPFAALTHPITVWGLYFGFMFVFFLSPLIDFAMLHMALMDVINLVFLLGGCCYWWPMVGLDPIVHWKMGYGARMLNVLVGAAPETFLGIAIMSQQTPIASMYSLSSTHAGGGMLWASTELATVIGFIPIFLQWMRSDERAAARADVVNQREATWSSVPPLARRRGWRPVSRVVTSTGLQAARSESGRQLSVWEAAWLAKAGSVPNASSVDGSRDVQMIREGKSGTIE